MQNISNIFRLLGDETRLRILNLVSQASLNVSELTCILGLAQSGVSRHLSHLKKAGLLTERKDGVWSYYALEEFDKLSGELRLFWDYLKNQLKALDDPHHDNIRLQELLKKRDHTGPGLNERLLEPGLSWLTWSRALAFLQPSIVVADLGCGDGTLTVEMARFASKVYAVDTNPKNTVLVQQKAERLKISQIKLLNDSVYKLSIDEAQCDLAVFSQSLHHLESPSQGLAEAFRILKPGGALLVMELAPHQQEWVKSELGHQWMGFEIRQLRSMLQEVGFERAQLEMEQSRRNDNFRVVLGVAFKP